MKVYVFFFQAEDGIRDIGVTGVQTCALPILVACSTSLSERPFSRRFFSRIGPICPPPGPLSRSPTLTVRRDYHKRMHSREASLSRRPHRASWGSLPPFRAGLRRRRRRCVRDPTQ